MTKFNASKDFKINSKIRPADMIQDTIKKLRKTLREKARAKNKGAKKAIICQNDAWVKLSGYGTWNTTKINIPQKNKAGIVLREILGMYLL